jgi:hypothetical protein
LSRNKDRTGASQPDVSPPAALTQPQVQSNDNGFSFVVPTEFVELPSKGLFYPEAHPLRGQDSIEIRQMTAKEEDLLTSKTLLRKGLAIDRLLQSVIVDKRINPDSLLVGDRNALLIAIRVSGYGNEYRTKIQCPSCDYSQESSFDLNSFNIYNGDDMSKLDIVSNDDGTFTTILPKTQLKIGFRLLCGKDEKNLVLGMKSDRQQKIHERGVTRQLSNFIVSVNDNKTSEAINYVVNNIPSMDSRHLRLAYKLAAPNIDLTQVFICQECDHEQDLEVPLTSDFFWPDR